MTFQEYLSEVHKEFAYQRGTWRIGQTFFNVLYRIKPVLANHIRATKLDPFYQDERVTAFCDYVERMWNANSYAAVGDGSRDDSG